MNFEDIYLILVGGIVALLVGAVVAFIVVSLLE